MRSPRRLVPATLTLLVLLAYPRLAAAQTFVSGTLSANTTWTLAQSPFVVTTSVEVPAGITLTIEPGVVVRFEAAQGLHVHGTLVARGTPGARILLTSTQPTVTPGFWGAVYFSATSVSAIVGPTGQWTGGSVLEHVIVEGAGHSGYYGNVDIHDSRPLIDSVIVRDSAQTAIYAFISTPAVGTMRVRNSQLTSSQSGSIGIEDGISISYRGHVALEGNVIHGFRSRGIALSQYFEPTVSDVRIADNTLLANDYGIYSTAGATTNLQLIDNQIRNGGVGVYVSQSGSGLLEITGNVVQTNARQGLTVESPTGVGPSVTVSHNVLADNGGTEAVGIWSGWADGLSVSGYGDTRVTNNVIAGNISAQYDTGGAWVRVTDGTLVFTQNLIAGNIGRRESGVLINSFGSLTSALVLGNTITQNVAHEQQSGSIWPSALSIWYTPSTLHGNNLFGNISRLSPNQYALVYRTYGPIGNATGNWWGTTDPSVIQSLISPGPEVPPALVDASAPLGGINTNAPISPPTGLVVTRSGSTANISWNANPEIDVVGYRVWYGLPGDPTYSGTGATEGPSPIDVGNATSFQLTGLAANAVVSVTAYDTARDGTRDQTDGHESWFTPPARPTLVLTSLTADATAPMVARSGSVVFSAQAAGGLPPYRYKWTVSHVPSWQQGVWTNSNTYYLDAHIPNPYHVSVEVQSINNLTDSPDNANAVGAMDFTITPAPLTLSITSSDASPQPAGRWIVFYGNAAGGSTNYEYKWRLSTDGGATYSTVQDWSINSTFAWQTSVPVPNARINLWVRDGGTADTPQIQATLAYVITGSTGPVRLVSITPNPPSPQMSETTIDFTATATGGTAPYQYKWWLHDGVAWRVIQEWSGSNRFFWFPQVVGTFRIGVWVRNAGSTADIYDNDQANGSIEYVLTPRIPTLTSLHSELPSPQPVGTPIRFWASAYGGGVATIQYKWRVSLDGGASYFVAREWNTDASFVWTPTSPTSNARINVWVRRSDVSADAPQAELTVPFVVTAMPNELVLNSITASPASPQMTGTQIVFIANASGGTAPRQYKWWIFNGSWNVVRDWSTSQSFVWTPAAAGTFRIAVWVRNAGNTADAYENPNSNGSLEYVITSPAAPLSITSLTSSLPSPQVRGTSIIFTTTSAGGTTPHHYKWRVSNDGGATFATAQDWSANASFIWTPADAIADARISVWVRNNGVVGDAPEAQAATAYVITNPVTGPLTLNSITSSVLSPQQVGVPITFTANASGGTDPYQYKWWILNGSWQVVQDWSTSNTFTWTPAAASSAYRIAVWVRSDGNTVDAYENANANGSIGYEISGGVAPLTISSYTANPSTSQIAIGTPIAFLALATGGTPPYQYKFRLSTDGGATYTTARDWSTTNVFTWTPAAAMAVGRMQVWVRNSGDTVDAPQSERTITFEIIAPSGGPLVLNAIVPNLPAPQPAGTPITFTANTTGGVAPLQYKWWVFDGIWNVARNWTADNTFTWTPASGSNAYRIAVWVRSASNTADTYDNPNSNGSISYPITGTVVPPPTLSSLTANLPSPQVAGTPITFTAAATGGSGSYQFKWRVSTNGGVEFTTALDWGPSTTFTWTPEAATANARISVWVRNTGETADMPQGQAGQATMLYVITPASATPLALNSIVSNLPAPQSSGTTITFTANASGGVAPLQYKWWVFDGGGWNIAQNWSTSNTFAWTPSSASNVYRIAVWVRSAGNTNDSYDNANSNGSIGYVITTGQSAGPLVLNSIVANLASPRPAGTTITFTANASGGTGPYQYKWWIFDGSWQVVQDWSTSDTFAWTPSAPSSAYRVAVWVRNAGSTADAYDNANSNGSIGFVIVP